MPFDLPPLRQSVARQLMLRLAMVGTVFALLTTVVASLIEYRDEIGKIDAVFTDIEEGYLGSVAETLWLEDHDRLALLTMGISRLPNVRYAEVRDANGALRGQAGVLGPEFDVKRNFPLSKLYRDQKLAIGQLTVAATTAPIRRTAIASGLVFGAANLLLVLTASAFLHYLLRKGVGKPLERLALSARQLGRGKPDVSFLTELEQENAGNEFGILVKTLSDMQTELVSALKELKTSERRYRELFTHSPIAFWEEDFSAVKSRLDELRGQTENLDAYLVANPGFIDECGRLASIISVNDAAARLYGAASRDDLLGALPRVLTPSSRHILRQGLLALWAGEEEMVQESEVRTLTGDLRNVVIHWLVLPADKQASCRILVSQEDITERAAARHSLALTVERLMQSNSELERFSHAAAHDLAEPVRSIVSFSQLLERRLSDSYDKEIKEYLGFLIAAARRMQAQVQGLRDYVRLGEGVDNRGGVELQDLAQKAVDFLKEPIRLAQATVEIGPLPHVYANAEQITDVFRNLIDNAVKFRRPGEPPRIRINAERIDGEWTICVADNGIGIDPRYASDIFQVFRRLNPPSHATGEGIGLSLCRRAIERHGGRMWVESSLGQGSAFHFTLPASDGEGKEAEEATPAS